MNSNYTTTLISMIVAISSARFMDTSDDCCTVFSKRNFKGPRQEYCLDSEDQSRQDAFNLYLRKKRNNAASIICGKNVDATICPNGYELGPVANQRELRYICDSGSNETEEGFKVGANQKFSSLNLDKRAPPSIILQRHHWVAKGTHYMGLDREDKADILWDKIQENETRQEAVPFDGFF